MVLQSFPCDCNGVSLMATLQNPEKEQLQAVNTCRWTPH